MILYILSPVQNSVHLLWRRERKKEVLMILLSELFWSRWFWSLLDISFMSFEYNYQWILCFTTFPFQHRSERKASKGEKGICCLWLLLNSLSFCDIFGKQSSGYMWLEWNLCGRNWGLIDTVSNHNPSNRTLLILWVLGKVMFRIWNRHLWTVSWSEAIRHSYAWKEKRRGVFFFSF